MLFVLSKITEFLQNPFSWILGLAIAALVVKSVKTKKKLIVLAGFFFVFFGNEPFIDQIIRAWEIPPVRLSELKPNYPLGVILCGVTSPGSQPDDRVNVLSSPDRILHPVMLYRKGFINRILISGGSASIFGIKKKSEAEEVREVLLLCGIPDSLIMMEGKSRNTHENAKYSSEIIKQMNIGNDFLLITSAFHMHRSMACFAKQGLTPQPFSVNASGHKDNPIQIDKLFIPSAWGYVKWNTIIHELLGHFFYKMSGYI